jgi:large subunit ribosomal protein L21
MYAILKTGGKQYTVKENDMVQIEKLDVPAGEKVVLTDVLFVSDDSGSKIGAPLVEGASITAKVVRHDLGEKIIGRTYKPKKNESRRYGHRQKHTQILIEKIAM